MRKVTDIECEIDSVQVGWFADDEWRSLEDDDAEESIADLLKRKDSRELILRAVLDFSMQLREAIHKDLLELYDRTESD